MVHPTLRLTSGFPEKSPHLRDEVKILQLELVRWGYRLTPDGYFGPGTEAAVKSFQRKHGMRDDGIVGPKTWDALLAPQATNLGASFQEPSTTTTASTGGGQSFPFPTVTSYSWSTGSRAFGSSRSGGARAHAGCDLYYPKGTWIHAVANGTVINGPYSFYCETYALEVDHGSFVVRYGEIQSYTPVKKGDRVAAGQRIAQVGHLVGISVPSDMLHIEMYDGSASGALTVKGAGSAKRNDGVPFQRRSDLIDPTPYLNQWKSTLPKES